jgi:hypothetical protein
MFSATFPEQLSWTRPTLTVLFATVYDFCLGRKDTLAGGEWQMKFGVNRRIKDYEIERF